MKRGLALAFVVGLSLSPACGREKTTFNNRAPIVDTGRAVKMADGEKLTVIPKKAEEKAAETTDAGAVPAPQPKATPPKKKGIERDIPRNDLLEVRPRMIDGPQERPLTKRPQIH